MRSATFAMLTRAAPLLIAVLLGTGCGGSDMMLGPEAEAPVTPLVFPDEPFRATRPAPGMMASYQPPQPETFALDNGMKVVLVERRTIPHVSWYLVFPGGSMMDPPGKEGLASLCLNVAFQATNTLSRSDREQALADLGSTVGLGVGISDVVFTGDALQPHLAATAQLWADLFLAPALRQTDFDGTVRARVNGLAAGPSQTPAAIATRVSSRLHWGPQHPYNRMITNASLQAVTLADCRDFFAAAVRPMGARLFVAGAVNRAELVTAFAPLVAMSGAGTMPLALPPATREPGTVFFVHSPAAPQSIITLRGAGPARTAPEYFAGELMAGILAGDSITSRIGLNLREMRGFAYSFSGGFSYSPAGGSFFFSAPVRADATAESLFEVLAEIRRMREAGVTPEELEGERRGRVAGLPYQFETAAGTLGQYDTLETYGLPVTYFATYAQSFEAVTPATAQQAATQYLQPSSLQVLIVGDAATVVPKLRALIATHPELMGTELKFLTNEGNPTMSGI